MLVYFIAIWSILGPFGILSGFYRYLVYLYRFGMLNQDKSDNQEHHARKQLTSMGCTGILPLLGLDKTS
jgi:hypothetical protein